MSRYRTHLLLLVAILASLGISLNSAAIDSYYMDVLLQVGINVILAVSLNLINGHTGQFSLGHAAFMAVGAYGAAIVTLESGGQLIPGTGALPQAISFLLALLAGGLCAGVLGWVVGVPTLRLRGDYLAIVTLGFNEIVRVVLTNTKGDSIFGGALGLKGIPENSTFFWVFTIAAISIYVIGSLVRSTYGRGFLVVRDDEVAGEAMGVHTVRYKVFAFVIGAFFAGLAGGLYAHLRTTIAPEGFNFLKSVDIVVMVILGGMGNTAGVVLAAVVLTILNEYLRDFEEYRMIIFSLLLIILMIVRPQGLLGPDIFKRRRKTA